MTNPIPDAELNSADLPHPGRGGAASVMVDDRPLHVDSLGLQTVGQVLTHLQRDNRLIVHVLIDGQEPDLGQMQRLRAAPLLGHAIFIETTEPAAMAAEVLDDVEGQLIEAERVTGDSVDLLQGGQPAKAIEKLRGCFSIWQHAQESVTKTSALLRIDLSRILVDGRPFSEVLGEFAQQLRLIKTALENRDFVSLADTLAYEMSETSKQWRGAIRSMRATFGA